MPARREQGQRLPRDRHRIGQAPDSAVSRTQRARLGVDHVHAAATQCCHIGLRGARQPHVRVHGGRDDDRSGTGENRERHHVVGEASCELGERVGRCRDDDDQVRDASELHVLSAPLPRDVDGDRTGGDALPRRTANEVQRGQGCSHTHVVARALTLADHDGGFECRDAAGHTDDNARHGQASGLDSSESIPSLISRSDTARGFSSG